MNMSTFVVVALDVFHIWIVYLILSFEHTQTHVPHIKRYQNLSIYSKVRKPPAGDRWTFWNKIEQKLIAISISRDETNYPNTNDQINK